MPTSRTSDLAAEVYVVDNASTDGTAEAVAAAFPQVKLIASAENLGFGGANNLRHPPNYERAG